MKIAYILSGTVTTGGATKAFITLLKGVMAKEVTPIVIVPDKEGVYHQLLTMGIRTYVLPYRANTWPGTNTIRRCIEFIPRVASKLLLNAWAAYNLTQILQKEKVDLIHTNSSVINIGNRAARKLKIPHVRHLREYIDKDFGMHYIPSEKMLQTQLNKSGTYTICITKDIQHHHNQTEGKHSTVIYDGVRDRQECMPQKYNHQDNTTSTKEDYFLCVARLEQAKGVDLLLHAYNDYSKQTDAPLPLYIAGNAHDDLYTQQLYNYVTTNHLTEKIHFLGLVDNPDTLMQHAKALIVPSRFEGFGFCMPEAMFNGCLVIAKRTGGSKEQITNGLATMHAPIALDYTTEEQLTKRLIEVDNADKQTYDAMKARAFEMVNNNYTTQVHVDKVYQFYQRIV